MSTKHFITDPDHLVETALRSITLVNPSTALDAENKIVYLRPTDENPQVSIVSGGGSGHEPAFAGFVGSGLLSAAVAGTIFASPSAKRVRAAVMSRVNVEKGVLVVVMNYTGDILNFGMAVEKARAAGIKVEMVAVADDVGVGREKAGKVGRRGIAGTVLVLKIAGALAAMGYNLRDVRDVAKLAAENIVSVGASLDHVHVPGHKLPDPESDEILATGEVEIGMGIHNEPGSGKAAVGLPELVKNMLKQLLDWTDEDRAYLKVNSNEVVLLVNNLGGVSALEMGGITTEVAGQLEKDYNIKPIRLYSGTFMTSLNGLGFSISILNIVNTNLGGPGMLQLLDAPSEATGWAVPVIKETWEARSGRVRELVDIDLIETQPSGLTMDPSLMKKTLTAALERIIAAEPEITRYDTVVGDGDCGVGLKRGAEAVLRMLSEHKLSGDVVVDISRIVQIVENVMDGTSGALYVIFLNSLVQSLRQQSVMGEVTLEIWANALQQSLEAFSNYTPAQPGDRTLVDALFPFVKTLNSTGDIAKAADVSRKGAESTKGMRASFGRTVYVGGKGYKQVPDPGAWGLSELFLGLAGVDASATISTPESEDYEIV